MILPVKFQINVKYFLEKYSINKNVFGSQKIPEILNFHGEKFSSPTFICSSWSRANAAAAFFSRVACINFCSAPILALVAFSNYHSQKILHLIGDGH